MDTLRVVLTAVILSWFWDSILLGVLLGGKRFLSICVKSYCRGCGRLWRFLQTEADGDRVG